MNLVGIMPVRNEEWCLGLSARAALMWCDSLHLFLHRCEDSSLEIATAIQQEFPERVVFTICQDPEWREMEQRQEMLENARRMYATHLAIVDADEILTGNLLGQIRQHVESLPASSMLQLPGYNLRGALTSYHASGVWGRRWFSTAFKDTPKANWQGDDFHHREPFGVMWNAYQPLEQRDGGVMHLWGASERRLRAKHALYKCTEALRWPEKSISTIDQQYSQAIYGRPWMNELAAHWIYRGVDASWWEPYQGLMQYLNLQAEPWQIGHTRALVEQHGKERFAGLDLFGVV